MAFSSFIHFLMLFLSGMTNDVFLSFNHEDTGKAFSDHLHRALTRSGIRTFRGDDGIRRGKYTALEIKKAIKSSRSSLIVFSKEYASSTRCLDELVMIIEARRTTGHVVVPVFYDVHPSEVGEQTGSYGEEFAEHENRFKEEMDRVNRWRAALAEIADLAGMVLHDRYESQFIQNIVEEVGNRLNRMVPKDAPSSLGMDSRITLLFFFHVSCAI